MDDLTNPDGPSVLSYGHPKREMVTKFVNDYMSAFDTGADGDELYTDIITDLFHLYAETQVNDCEADPQLIPGDIDNLHYSACAHWVAETPLRVEYM